MDPKNLPEIESFRDKTDVQIRFNDVDVLGHVNNTIYFALYDTGKAHYMSAVRGSQMDWKHVDTVIANIDCCFLQPMFFGEEIEVLTKCVAIHEKSFRLQQAIREKNTGVVKSMCETVMVCFDPTTGKVHDVPETWRKDLSDFEGTEF